MTNYVENILTKDEEHVYTVDIPKDVENIKVHVNVSPHIIEGLKEQFPYEGICSAYDCLNGVITLHKTPQTDWDKRKYHLKQAKRHVEIANEMVPYAPIYDRELMNTFEKSFNKKILAEKDTKFKVSDWIEIGIIGFLLLTGVFSVCDWLYKLIF